MRLHLAVPLVVLTARGAAGCHSCSAWSGGSCGSGVSGAAQAASHSGNSCTPSCPDEFCPASVRSGLSCVSGFPPCPFYPPSPPMAPPPSPPVLPPPHLPPRSPPPQPPMAPFVVGEGCVRTSNCATNLVCACQSQTFWQQQLGAEYTPLASTTSRRRLTNDAPQAEIKPRRWVLHQRRKLRKKKQQRGRQLEESANSTVALDPLVAGRRLFGAPAQPTECRCSATAH